MSNASTVTLYGIIDHTMLAVDATRDQIVEACETAVAFQTATVCVRPEWVRLAASITEGSGVGVTTVVGFPTGTETTAAKAREAALAVENGATEVDMVVNVDWLTSGLVIGVQRDILAVRDAVGLVTVMKVILETATLTDEQIGVGCLASEFGGADFVKTSTGFHPAGGASEHAVALMAATVPDLGVKASGGVRTLDDMNRMLDAGATRIGTSATAFLTGDQHTTGY